MPDPQALYLLEYNASFFSGDGVQIELTDNGLLQSVLSTSVDKYSPFEPKIVLGGIAPAASQYPATAAVSSPAKSFLGAAPVQLAMNVETMTQNNAYGQDFLNLLAKFGNTHNMIFSVSDESRWLIQGPDKTDGLELVLQFERNQSVLKQAHEEETISNDEYDNLDGVAFKIAQPFTITMTINYVKSDGATAPILQQEFLALLPDQSLTYYLPFDRYLFVESTMLALFKEGQLNRAALEKLTLVDKLVAIPSVLGSAMLDILQSFAQFTGDTISGRSKTLVTGAIGAGI